MAKTKEPKNSISEKLLGLLKEKGSDEVVYHNSKRRIKYKVSVTDGGLEIRRATSGGNFPDKEGYKWSVDGELNLETVDKAIGVIKDDFKKKRNQTLETIRLEKFKKTYYSIVSDYGTEFAEYLMEEPEMFLKNVRVGKWEEDEGKSWDEGEYKADVDEWVYWSVDFDSVYEYVSEMMICDEEEERQDGQYSSDDFDELAGKMDKTMNYFAGGVARVIKSCTGFEEGCYGAYGLRFDHRFYSEFKEYDKSGGESHRPKAKVEKDEEDREELDYTHSMIEIGDTPDSIAHNVSIREGDLSFIEGIEERIDKWDWKKVCRDAVMKINKELGKDAVIFAYADYEYCVAEYVVGNEIFAAWFKRRYPGVDLKEWLRSNVADEDGEYLDSSYGRTFDFEEWWETQMKNL